MINTDKTRLKIHLAIFLALLIIGMSGFTLVEKVSITDAFYFTIVTMATVGYGDIHPQTVVGKVLALIVIVGGVGTFLGVIASFTDLLANRREEELRQQKLNLVTGLFFSEMGNDLLKLTTSMDKEIENLAAKLKISIYWQDKEISDALEIMSQHLFEVSPDRKMIGGLKDFVQDKRDLLLRLLENPHVHEHEKFTDLLQAVFHLRDELLHRDDIKKLPDSDVKHLEGDINRVYALLAMEWLRYARYLKTSYPYLYSLAIRLNPFDPDASAVIEN